MTEPALVHRLDVDSLNGGRLLLALGIVVGPFSTIVGGRALLGGDGGAMVGLVLLVPGVFGLLCLPIGLRALSLPTAGGSVRISSEGLEVTLRRRRLVSVPWSDISHWGVVPKPLWSSSSLVLWPADDSDVRANGNASPLGSKRQRGWVLEAVDPGPELVADLEAISPRPRRDAKH
ncbi:MAG: hypothetical protein ACRDP8_04920 [Actinopolymorphaceae bacterium]